MKKILAALLAVLIAAPSFAAAPVAGIVQLPDDSGNTGNKMRTQTRTVGANTVDEQFFIPVEADEIVGKYKASTGVLTVPAAVHNGTTTGFAWLQMPVGTTKKMRITRVCAETQFIALAVDLLGGELRYSRHTFTGTGTAGLITAGKRDSTDAANVGELRTASTGEAVTLVATVFAHQHPTMDLVTGGAGHWPPYKVCWEPERREDMVVLRAGEGISMWHAVAVTAANRRLYITIAWEEFE